MGYKISIDYNKRGGKNLYDPPFFALRYRQSHLEIKSILLTKSLSLAFTPTLKILDKLQLFLGPHLTYSLINETEDSETYYRTSAKEEALKTFIDNSSFNGKSFSDRLSFGIKLGVTYKIANRIDLGLAYQYSRLIKIDLPTGSKPFYNIINLTTNVYFKSR